MLLEQPSSCSKPRRLIDRSRTPFLAGERVQQPQHLVQVCEDVRLRPAERGQPQPGELLLQLAQVVLAQPDVVDEIDGAGRVGGMDRLQPIPEPHFEADEVAAQLGEHLDDLADDARVPRRHGSGRRNFCGW